MRFPHPALGGRRYGESLLQGIAARGFGPGRSGVVELGGGAGHVAECAWRGEAASFTGAPWTSVDLSPSLLSAQRRRVLEKGQPRGVHQRWSGVRADAVELPFRPGSIDGLVLANEVIADLEVRDGRNTGALVLVRELARVLAPRGGAVLTEFGGDFAPRPIRLHAALGEGEHVEWTIDFRALRAEASAVGLRVEEVALHELLGADLSVRCASYTDLWRLRRFARCEVFAAPAAEVRKRFPVLSRLLALELPELGSKRWPDAQAQGGFSQLFRALLLRK